MMALIVRALFEDEQSFDFCTSMSNSWELNEDSRTRSILKRDLLKALLWIGRARRHWTQLFKDSKGKKSKRAREKGERETRTKESRC